MDDINVVNREVSVKLAYSMGRLSALRDNHDMMNKMLDAMIEMLTVLLGAENYAKLRANNGEFFEASPEKVYHALTGIMSLAQVATHAAAHGAQEQHEQQFSFVDATWPELEDKVYQLKGSTGFDGRSEIVISNIVDDVVKQVLREEGQDDG